MELFENFDFSILKEPSFKEDSVREEIIVPILSKLGYKATGPNKIIRSKALEHPFVQFGTKSVKVTIIPDYLLQINNKYLFVLDAKAPSEPINTGKNVEQTFSYAAHREIKSNLYGLCNGNEIIIFDINETKPKLHLKITELDSKWEELYKIISPLALTKPHIFNFSPDFGYHLRRLGFDDKVESTFFGLWANGIAKISDDLFSIMSSITFEGKVYLASFDFHRSLLQTFLSILPAEKRGEIKRALSNAPFKFDINSKDDSVNIGIVAKLSTKVEYGKEVSFVPFIILNFIDKR